MLSTTTQYALRALSHLARQSGDAVLGRDLAESVEIPANYLSKVLVTLRNAGLVVTTRGSGGGYRLRKPAHEIHLIDVVELLRTFRALSHAVFSAAHERAQKPVHVPLTSRGRGCRRRIWNFLFALRSQR
jgi:Rrf2 family protein